MRQKSAAAAVPVVPLVTDDTAIRCVRCLRSDVDLDGDGVCEDCVNDRFQRRIAAYED
jgi:hypothetical protein